MIPPDSQDVQGHSGMRRIVKAFGYSMDGLRSAYRGEAAFRQEVWAAVILIPSAFWLGRNPYEVWALIAVVVLLMIVELLNSGIEAAVDRVSMERHPLAKKAKDQASAAVFLSVLLCVGTWGAVLVGRLLN